jgi:hypothetical protein
MDQLNLSPPPPADKVPLQDYKPIASGPRLAGEKNAVLGAAGPGDDLWGHVKVVLFVIGFLLLLFTLFPRRWADGLLTQTIRIMPSCS